MYRLCSYPVSHESPGEYIYDLKIDNWYESHLVGEYIEKEIW